MRFRTRFLGAAACIVAGACGAGGSYGNSSAYGSPPASPTSPANPAPDLINATATLAFTPPTLTTQTGHTVVFAFASVGHNVFFDAAAGAPADIQGVNADTSVSRTFNTAGTFTYTCHIHPYMQGIVIVQ